MLSIRNLVAGYGKIAVLHGVALAAERGQMIGVLGPNGAGKSTLLKAVAGLLPVESGQIQFGDADVTYLSPDQRVRRGIVYIPEGRGVFAPLTVKENLLLGLYPRRRGLGKAETNARLESAFALFPVLKERLRQRAGHLSGGEQQMLAIARGVLSDPKVLMLDEPSLGLAPMVIEEIFLSLRSLNRDRGLTVILAEQNAVLGMELAEHLYIIENGKVVLSGSSATLQSDQRVVAAYLSEIAPAG